MGLEMASPRNEQDDEVLTHELTADFDFNDDIILKKFTDPSLRKMEEELRNNGGYWVVSGFTEPVRSKIFTLQYFSRHVEELEQIRQNLTSAKNLNGMKLLKNVSDELEHLFSHSDQVRHIISIASDYERNILIEEALQSINNEISGLSDEVKKSRFQAIDGSLSSEKRGAIVFRINKANMLIDRLVHLFQGICDEVRSL